MYTGMWHYDTVMCDVSTGFDRLAISFVLVASASQEIPQFCRLWLCNANEVVLMDCSVDVLLAGRVPFTPMMVDAGSLLDAKMRACVDRFTGKALHSALFQHNFQGHLR